MKVYRGGKWVEINEDARIETLDYIRDNFNDKIVKVTDIADHFGISRQSATLRLNRLFRLGYLRSKRISRKRSDRDSRIYLLRSKGREGIKKQVRKKEVQKEEEKKKWVYVEK